MARLTADQIAQRNANLQTLKTAVDDWAAKEEARVVNESKFIKSVLQARGADTVAALNLLEGTEDLGDEIDRFLLLGT